MRDLGTMGESTFSLWCAEVGLVHNGSRIDKTGWDFYVEFPFNQESNAEKLHIPAIECKIQVKATDKVDRKLSIKLSNLRRLITAQMPAFFVFIEFDGKNTAQRAYIRHIDGDLISKILKRIHEIEQLEGRTDHHKRTMTIPYDQVHEIKQPFGHTLKSAIESCTGKDMAEYIAKKKKILESAGFENGTSHISFTTEGEENLRHLIDVSIGARKSVDIQSFTGHHIRFGIKSRSPIVSSGASKIEMPDLKPSANGFIHFREHPLSPSLTHACKLYASPLNAMLPKELTKMRIEGDFFDIKFNPYTGVADYTFNGYAEAPVPLHKLREILRLIQLITSSSKRIQVEFDFKGLPAVNFKMNCLNQPFDLGKELHALDCAIKALSDFDIAEPITATLNEISKQADSICQLHSILCADHNAFKIEFGVTGEGFNSKNKVACIIISSTRIGEYIFGAIITIKGNVENIDNDRYRLITTEFTIEQKILSRRNGEIPKIELIKAIEIIEKKYAMEFEVVTMFDKDKSDTSEQPPPDKF